MAQASLKTAESAIPQEVTLRLGPSVIAPRRPPAAGPGGAMLASLGGIAPPGKHPCFRLYADADGKRQIIAAESDSVAVRGTNFRDGASETERTAQYLVGVLRRGDPTLVLHRAPVFAAQRTLKKSTLVHSESSREDLSRAVTELGEVFGNRKTKTILRARERNTIDATAFGHTASHVTEAAEAAADAAAELSLSSPGSASTAQGSQSQSSVKAFTPMPLHTPGAQTVEEAYPLAGLFGTVSPMLEPTAREIVEARKQLTDEHLANNNMVRETVIRETIANALPNKQSAIAREALIAVLDVPTSGEGVSENPLIRRVTLALLVECLVTLVRANRRSVNSPHGISKLLGYAPNIAHAFMADYYEQVPGTVGRMKPVFGQGTERRIQLHVIIAAVRLQNPLPLAKLACDLGISIQKTEALCRALGCSVTRRKADSEFIVKIMLPLVIPDPNVQRRGAKRARN